MIGPLWRCALHVGFIRLLGVNAVHTSADAARIGKPSDLLDVLASKASAIWSADLRRRIGGAGGEYGRDERNHQSRDERAHRLTRRS